MSVITPGEEALATYRQSGLWHAEQAGTHGRADDAHRAAFDLLRRAYCAEWGAVAADRVVHPPPCSRSVCSAADGRAGDV